MSKLIYGLAAGSLLFAHAALGATQNEWELRHIKRPNASSLRYDLMQTGTARNAAPGMKVYSHFSFQCGGAAPSFTMVYHPQASSGAVTGFRYSISAKHQKSPPFSKGTAQSASTLIQWKSLPKADLRGLPVMSDVCSSAEKPIEIPLDKLIDWHNKIQSLAQ